MCFLVYITKITLSRLRHIIYIYIVESEDEHERYIEKVKDERDRCLF
jgi:hypothetical protein